MALWKLRLVGSPQLATLRMMLETANKKMLLSTLQNIKWYTIEVPLKGELLFVYKSASKMTLGYYSKISM